jgi:beta-phosphoglucomutase
MRAGPGVIFDFDGVIADSESLHLRAFQQAFAARGWKLSRGAYYERYLGSSDRDVIDAFAVERGEWLTPADRTNLLESKGRIYEALAAGGALCPGADACIRRLDARFPLAIASGALRHEIEHTLDAAGLRDKFLTIVGADDVVQSKPAPDPYLEAARRIGVAPGACVAIEDSPWGLESGRAAGLRTIGITHSYPTARLKLADVVVETLDEVTVSLIEELIKR